MQISQDRCLLKGCRHQVFPAFTLAELLIALAILGVIATFTIPKVLQNQQDERRSAIFKETIATLMQITHTGRLTGELKSSTVNSYYLNRLNAVKICQSNSYTQGCWDWDTNVSLATAFTRPGAKLHNGVTVYGFSNGLHWTGDEMLDLVIDWNGAEPPNTNGQDILGITINYGNTTHTYVSTQVRAGTFDCNWHSAQWPPYCNLLAKIYPFGYSF